MKRTVLRGATLCGASGAPVDILIEAGVITAVGAVGGVDADVVDVGGRLVLPGFVDVHSHADGVLSDAAVQRALLKQGVTTVITGQDGVSYAPGNGAYATEYFAAINGPADRFTGGGVGSYLASIDGASAVNAGYLVPAGTVRSEICGRATGAASADDCARMAALVGQGMAEGALGLSTGLDYVPGILQTADEIAALCDPVAAAAGVYVTHMRGGYEANSAAGVSEIVSIAQAVRSAGGVDLAVHVSHFHADADIVLNQLEAVAAAGVDATFDAYPYIRGCTLLAMPLLPPELSAQPVGEVVRALLSAATRESLRVACTERAERSASLGPDWASMITLGHVAAPEFGWAHALTLADAARRVGSDPMTFAFDLLAASRLQVNAVMAVQNPRPATELARIFAHRGHMGGSDGIFIGAHPHPRAFGTFARYLREFVRELGIWSWEDAVVHLSTHPVQRFNLGRRGTIAPGAIADLIVVDPDLVADTSTYDDPRREAVGIDDVFVAGLQVLEAGELTGALPGRGLRRHGARSQRNARSQRTAGSRREETS